MFAAVRWVRDAMPRTVDARARLVAFAIASSAEKTGIAKIGQRRLAEITGMHTKTIARCVDTLEDAGIFKVERLDRRRSVYVFPVEDPLSPTARSRSAQLGYPQLRAFDGRTARVRGAHVGCVNTLENYSDVIRAQHDAACACAGGGFLTTIEHRNNRAVEVLVRCPGPQAMEASR